VGSIRPGDLIQLSRLPRQSPSLPSFWTPRRSSIHSLCSRLHCIVTSLSHGNYIQVAMPGFVSRFLHMFSRIQRSQTNETFLGMWMFSGIWPQTRCNTLVASTPRLLVSQEPQGGWIRPGDLIPSSSPR